MNKDGYLLDEKTLYQIQKDIGNLKQKNTKLYDPNILPKQLILPKNAKLEDSQRLLKAKLRLLESGAGWNKWEIIYD